MAMYFKFRNFGHYRIGIIQQLLFTKLYSCVIKSPRKYISKE